LSNNTITTIVIYSNRCQKKSPFRQNILTLSACHCLSSSAVSLILLLSSYDIKIYIYIFILHKTNNEYIYSWSSESNYLFKSKTEYLRFCSYLICFLLKKSEIIYSSRSYS